MLCLSKDSKIRVGKKLEELGPLPALHRPSYLSSDHKLCQLSPLSIMLSEQACIAQQALHLLCKRQTPRHHISLLNVYEESVCEMPYCLATGSSLVWEWELMLLVRTWHTQQIPRDCCRVSIDKSQHRCHLYHFIPNGLSNRGNSQGLLSAMQQLQNQPSL